MSQVQLSPPRAIHIHEHLPGKQIRAFVRFEASLLVSVRSRWRVGSEAEADLLAGKASRPKAISWYDADHKLEARAAARDRATWLHQ